MRNNYRLKRNRRSGVGLVELLVALSISAALLTAVAVATDTSFQAYAINQEQASLMQRGRVTLNRLMTYIRSYKDHQPYTNAQITQFASGLVVTDTGISMLTDAGVQLDFHYDAANKRILLEEAGTTRELLRGVETFSVKLEPMRSATSIKTGGPYDLLRRATIVLTVRTSGAMADINEAVDGQTVTLSSSVMPRKNAW